LNLSTRRYTEQEFDELLRTEGILCVALECQDRFGKYGIVGFCSVDERGAQALVTDFVLSCRVAQKRVEHTLFRWLAERALQEGREVLEADFIRTSRNGVLSTGLSETGFRPVSRDGDRELLALPLDGLMEPDGVIEVLSEVEGATIGHS